MADTGVLMKIHEGTGRLTGASLCRSCRYGRIHKDAKEEVIRCAVSGWNPLIIRGPVFTCNSYYNSALPSLASLEEIAWTLKTDGPGKKVGFCPPEPKK